MLKVRNYNPEDWSRHWIRSKQPRKQRKYLYNAPLHIRRKMFVSPLSKELREKLNKRNVVIRVGDKVKVERGDFRGKEGLVVYVDTKNYRVYVDSAYVEKKNGEKAYYPIHPSKLRVIALNLEDAKRREALGIDDKKLEELQNAGLVVSKEAVESAKTLNLEFR